MNSPAPEATAARAIWLVAEREVVTRAKTRSFLISTGLLMVVIIVGAIVLAALTGGSSVTRVGVVGADATLSQTIETVGAATGTSVTVVTIASADDARAQIANGDLAAALVPGTSADSYVAIAKNGLDPTLEGVLRSSVEQVAVSRALVAQGVDPATLPHAQITVESTTPVKPDETQRIVIAVVGTVVLVTAIIMGGSMVSVGVVEEKTSRVVELLLSTIKPLHLLWGKIIGIGAIALAQVLLLGATAIIAGKVTGLLTIPGAAVGMFAAVIAWFLLGFLFFATLYAATGALVSRQEELGASSAPLSILAAAVMYAGIFGVQALDSRFVEVLTWIPPFSASLMPIRIATGDTYAMQVIGTFALMVAACAGATWLAARIYQRSILRTGTRMRWSEALRLVR
ncbi:ABC transporter permease [Gordonia rhizosphera]|uniref:Putative ABC transporter permease protein n=1 Tax=Gordonia rhizosphera NBRC 16068 TaxID=1108045 RepID=K6W1X9_9ACTN|nr:ABC transporter permease [Gordonia rhizosphera]GAB93175.1 putative ABC transporter permease protein [Gordonia rhizosphera NBRC 16068]